MKKIMSITMIMIFGLVLPVLYAQAPCKVLKPQISGIYAGECKNGLAEGKGEATGEDFYKGDFVKGLPDGLGTYTWKNGATYNGQWKKGLRNGNGTYAQKLHGKDSVLTGKWKNDRYLGNPNSPAYTIDYRNSITRVTVIKVGDRPYIEYKFSGSGNLSHQITNLLLQGSSGSETVQTPFTGFEQVRFPFKGKVTFNVPNAFQTGMLSCELQFTIFEPGSWVVTMYY
jgi:hypothetical protein